MFFLTSNKSNKLTKLFVFCLIGILFISIIKFDSFGAITTDEFLQFRRINWQLDSLTSFLRDNELFINRNDYYGYFQKIPSFILYKLINPSKSIDGSITYYIASHFSIFVYTFISTILLSQISKKSKLKNNWLASALLLSSPVFLGHSIFNIKDIPFAMFYTLFSYFLINFYHAALEKEKNSKKILIIVCTLTSSFKLTILPILIIQILSVQILKDYKNNIPIEFSHVINHFLKLLFWCCLIIILITPHAWHDPLSYIPSSIYRFINYPWTGCNEFAGICTGKYYGDLNDWSTFIHLYNFLSIKFTLINIFQFFSSIIIFSKSIYHIVCKKKITSSNVTCLILGTQLFLIPLVAILTNQNTYDGVRHFLFIFPPMAFLGSFFMHELEKKLTNYKITKLLSIFFLLSLALNFVDTISLSPYQYTYVNEFSRTKHLQKKTDLDYWRASLAELYQRSKEINFFPEILPIRNRADYLKNPSLENFNKETEIFWTTRNIQRDINLIKRKYDINTNCKEFKVQRNYPITRHNKTLSVIYSCKKQN